MGSVTCQLVTLWNSNSAYTDGAKEYGTLGYSQDIDFPGIVQTYVSQNNCSFVAWGTRPSSDSWPYIDIFIIGGVDSGTAQFLEQALTNPTLQAAVAAAPDVASVQQVAAENGFSVSSDVLNSLNAMQPSVTDQSNGERILKVAPGSPFYENVPPPPKGKYDWVTPSNLLYSVIWTANICIGFP